MSANPVIEPSLSTPAALYSEKHAWLMRWAMHLCNKDRSAAEDLVQDVFMQMLVSWPVFQAAGEPEKLLYTYLKYSFLLKCRKDRRYSFQTLSAIDFESLHLSLRRETISDCVEVQDGLRRIVVYLSWRKQQAKAASVLLLRFFHGFFPSEIMQIGILTRRSVDTGLAQAREEAKSYIADPSRLQVMFRGAPPVTLPTQSVLGPEEFVASLRSAIFETRFGECLPESVLRERYLSDSPKAIECDLLAHITSCRKCLNLVCRWCKLPSMENRLPEEAWGFARRDKGSDAAPALNSLKRGLSNAGNRNAKKNDSALVSIRGGEQRFRVAYEHRPRALLVAVDGQMVAARDISSTRSQLKIELGATVPKELIEVMSEQELPLLTLPVLIAAGEGPQCIEHESKLANGQHVRLLLQFVAGGILLEVDCFDPFCCPALSGDQSAIKLDACCGEGSAKIGADGGRDNAAQCGDLKRDRFKRVFRHFMGCILDVVKWSRNFAFPIGITASAIAALCVLFGYLAQRADLPSAQILLDRAAMPNTARGGQDDEGVIVQTLRIRTKAGETRTGVEREVHRDLRGKKRTAAMAHDAEEKSLNAMLAVADVSWDDPLSAVSYRDWHNRELIRKDSVEKLSDGNFVLTSFVNDPELISESLTVRGTDFHPIDRTVDFRDREHIEVAELDYKVIPWTQANPSWFDPAISPSSVRLARPALKLPKRKVILPSEAQLDEAELGVRLGLGEVNADSSERLQVARSLDGVHVDGLVESEQRKQNIVSRLALVPHTIVNIRTFKEFEQQGVKSQSAHASTEGIAVAAQEAGLSPLERAFQEKGGTAEQAGSLAHVLFANSVNLQQSARMLDDLHQRFKPSALSPDALRILTQLEKTQLERLHTTIAEQKKSVQMAGWAGPMNVSVQSQLQTDSAAQQNLSQKAVLHARYCTELISQNTASTRASSLILADMAQSLSVIEYYVEQSAAEQADRESNSALDATAREQ